MYRNKVAANQKIIPTATRPTGMSATASHSNRPVTGSVFNGVGSTDGVSVTSEPETLSVVVGVGV